MRFKALLWRNIKWRCHHKLTIVMTIMQPMLWLLLYSSAASQTMNTNGIGNYTAFILPGLMILVCFSACSSTGIMSYLTRQDGSFYRILRSPAKRWEILTTQVLEAICCAFLEVFILILVGILLSVKIRIGLFELLIAVLLLFLTAGILSCITYAIALLLPDEAIYETMMNALVLPVFFLSSALFPVSNSSGLLHTIIYLNPFSHIIDTLRSCLLQGDPISANVPWLIAILLLLFVITFLWALRKLNQQTEE